MPSDFLAGVSEDLLNQASSEVYPGIKSELTETSSIPELDVAVTWAVTAAPVFELDIGTGDIFAMTVECQLDVTPDGGTEVTTPLSASLTCKVSMDGDGILEFFIKDILYDTEDEFLDAILLAKKEAIVSKLDSLLNTIKVPIGQVEGVTFNGFATEIRNSVLYAAGSLSGDASVDQELTVDSGFGISVSNELMQSVVENTWWADSDSTFKKDTLKISLDSYGFDVDDGELILSLELSGTLTLDLFLGTARWEVIVSPVTVKLEVDIDSDGNVTIESDSISDVAVVLSPDNFGAGLSSVTAPFTFTAIGLFIGEALQSQLEEYLDQTVFTVPVIKESFGGIEFSVTTSDLGIEVNGSQIDITGSAAVTVGS